MDADVNVRVLVIGASGRVGGEVCRQLRQAGAWVRAATRGPRIAEADDTLRVDLADPASLARALPGIDAAFLLWPFFEGAEDAHRKVMPIADLLGEQARRVVYLSSQGVEEDRHNFWGVVEDAVAARASEWTFLRPTGFAANARQWVPQIARGNVVRWPYGDLARPLIHEADMAAAATQALLSEGHHGRSYVLTGPERISQRAQVDAIGRALGRTLRWEDIGRAQAASEFDLPDMMLDGWEGFLTAPEPMTHEVERLTGRRARTFADWARENVDAFR